MSEADSRTEPIAELCRNAIAQIDRERERLTAALAALDGKPVSQPRTQRRSRNGSAPKHKGGRTPVLRNAVMAQIRKTPGARADEIAEALGRKVELIYPPVRELVTSGAVTREQAGRSSLLYPA